MFAHTSDNRYDLRSCICTHLHAGVRIIVGQFRIEGPQVSSERADRRVRQNSSGATKAAETTEGPRRRQNNTKAQHLIQDRLGRFLKAGKADLRAIVLSMLCPNTQCHIRIK